MAQEDIKPYEDKVAELAEISRVLMEIQPILKASRATMEYLGVKWYVLEEGYLAELNRVKGKELQVLEKYMNCAHVKTKEECTGNDSHKDYYEEKCINCGKTIKSWSI